MLIEGMNMANFEKMKSEDIQICTNIYLESFGHTKEEGLDVEGYLKSYIENKNAKALVYKESGNVVGFVTAMELPDMMEGISYYIDILVVDKNMQKKGYGTSMINDFINNISKEKPVWLITRKSDVSNKLYSKTMIKFDDIGYYSYSPLISRLNECIKEYEKEIDNMKKILEG